MAARRELEHLGAGVEKDVVDRSRLVVTELVANSVTHSGLGADQRIYLGVSVLPEVVRIEVGDGGRGFDPIAARPDLGQESGWGLWLVDQLTDRWGVDPGPGAHVWCELDRPGEHHGRRAGAPLRGRRPERGRPSLDMVGAFLAEENGAAGHRLAPGEALRGAPRRDGPHPLEFDESGFPAPQWTPGFVERVARLLEP